MIFEHWHSFNLLYILKFRIIIHKLSGSAVEYAKKKKHVIESLTQSYHFFSNVGHMCGSHVWVTCVGDMRGCIFWFFKELYKTTKKTKKD